MSFIDVKKEIKVGLADKSMKSKELIAELHRKYNRRNDITWISKKLNSNTIRFREVEEIFDILGYDISITKRK